ncbi:MAG: GAF domain-containing protein [Candidatus Omnitrophica bacterium]|nr:GAF domain-containing protein [Candidatus Omnitrophota bacterium]
MDDIAKDKFSILLVGSDEIMFKSLTEVLQREGYEVVTTRSGQEAIDLVKNRYFNLVVTDVNLSDGRDNIEVSRLIKESKKGLKTIVIFSDQNLNEDIYLRLKIANVDDYIFKPFSQEYFLHIVEKNLKLFQMELKLVEKTNDLTLLFDIGRELSSSLKLDEVLFTLVERICDVLAIERCSIVLLDETKDELYIAAAKGLPEEIILNTRIKIGHKISGWVFENKIPVLVDNIEMDPRFAKENEEKYYTGSFISVPLVFKEKVIGVINLNNKRSRQVFNEEDLRLIISIAGEAAIAIENAKLYISLERFYLQVISTLTSIIELKDHYTKGHSDRVTRYAVFLAETMGLSKAEVEIIKLACQLHDLGKIGIHDYILTKPAKLNEEEWKEIRLHPVKAVEMLKPLTFLKEEIKLIQQHHERYDGQGYPNGLNADQIDLKARIIAVVDSFDAMTTERPYARALTIEEAKEELRKNIGKQFDPNVVEVFIQLLEQNPDFFRKDS